MDFPIPAPPPRHVSECTCARLRRLTRRLTSVYDEQLAPTGLRVTQYTLLVTVSREGGKVGITLSNLAAVLDMDRTTLTRNLQPLATQRLIAISLDAADGRVRRARITAKGLAAMKGARRYWLIAQSQVNETLGEQNVMALHGWVDSVIPAFRSNSTCALA